METALDPHLPRVDLHRHLEGSIRVDTVLDLSSQHGLSLPAWDRAALEPHLFLDQPFADFRQAMAKISYFIQILVDYDACRRITWEFLEDAAREGLDYVELRFSPLFMAEPHGLDPAGVAAVVCEAWQEARGRIPVEARLIAILSRTYGPEGCWKELEAALTCKDKGIVGLDLAGDEARHPASEFVGHFRRAREAGWRATIHAGEFAGVDSIRQAVELLKADRIGHGIRAVDDPALMDLLAEREIPLECCPTSNRMTRSVESLRDHPLPRFIERGIIATINTDDPAWFGEIDLEGEYRIARDEIGMSREQLAQVQWNGLNAAFLDDAGRRALAGKIQNRSV